MLVVSAIAIPHYLRAKIQVNEAAAVANVRTLIGAQALYITMFPQVGYAADIKSLGGSGSSGALPTAAGLVGNNLEVAAHGYSLTIVAVTDGTLNTGYNIYGQPTTPGLTGRRGFCANESGVITFSDDGSRNCTAPIPF